MELQSRWRDHFLNSRSEFPDGGARIDEMAFYIANYMIASLFLGLIVWDIAVDLVRAFRNRAADAADAAAALPSPSPPAVRDCEARSKAEGPLRERHVRRLS